MTLVESFFETSQRLSGIPRSCVRDILDAAASRKIISFGGGIPNDVCVPVEAIRTAADRVLTKHGAAALRYGPSAGERDLREWIAREWLPRWGVPALPEDVLVTHGSQQALDLVGKVLLDRNAPILVERPTYLAAVQAFATSEPAWHDVPLDAQGPEPGLFRAQLENHKPRLFYTVPDFQNPTGRSISATRRAELVRILTSHNTPLVEDTPYHELWYDVPPPAPMSPELGPNAVLLSSFSKVVAPGFRLGFAVARGPLRHHMETVKQAADLCTGGFAQLLLLETIRSLDLDRHLDFIRSFYRRRRDEFVAALHRYLGGWIDFEVPDGGMFIWARVRAPVDTREWLRRCVRQHGVAFADGASFHACGGGSRWIRLNFTQADSADIEEGLALMAKELEAMVPVSV